MPKVKSRGNESAEALLRRFKKICEKDGLIRDMKKHAFYEKPSVIGARKRRQALKRKHQAQKEKFQLW
ncbi:MAG: 30S ribosomal protein S21 [Planctomycetaceae bacterium]|nr:30S ribosomal protein S21 [Planctomycetaceae bacterium]